MEVTAPNECCQTPLPGGLGLLVGWVGASGASAGSATLKDAALKAAAKKAAEQKSKKEKDKEEQEQEESQFQQFTQNNPNALAVLFHEIGVTIRFLFGTGYNYEAKTKDSDGNEVSIKDCQPSGPLNPNKVTCTQQKFELFTDPTDGIERWAFTLAVVEAGYNPKHIEANAQGYYPKVVDGQSITVVFETEADLIQQLKEIAAAR